MRKTLLFSRIILQKRNFRGAYKRGRSFSNLKLRPPKINLRVVAQQQISNASHGDLPCSPNGATHKLPARARSAVQNRHGGTGIGMLTLTPALRFSCVIPHGETRTVKTVNVGTQYLKQAQPLTLYDKHVNYKSPWKSIL